MSDDPHATGSRAVDMEKVDGITDAILADYPDADRDLVRQIVYETVVDDD